VKQGSIPGGTTRNWASYGHKVGAITDEQRTWLCDPQTSGGLLVSVDQLNADHALQVLAAAGVTASRIGAVAPASPDRIKIR
jgi:selenide,water dikinase